jgi:hypothetical protein
MKMDHRLLFLSFTPPSSGVQEYASREQVLVQAADYGSPPELQILYFSDINPNYGADA